MLSSYTWASSARAYQCLPAWVAEAMYYEVLAKDLPPWRHVSESGASPYPCLDPRQLLIALPDYFIASIFGFSLPPNYLEGEYEDFCLQKLEKH